MDRVCESSSCWIVWDKLNTCNFADCELAYTSFKTAVRKFSFMWNGMMQGDMKNKEIRIHPTQKPVQLYNWLLHNYAKPGQRILDTHLGSGSSAIAAHYFGVDFVGCELDKDYYKAAVERFALSTAQQTLF
jgi:site-specific DNA-methyltransferase (adenine-specific)